MTQNDVEFLAGSGDWWKYLIGEEHIGGLTEDGEAHGEHNDVSQRGDNAQEHSIAHLEGHHGEHSEDNEEEERNLRTRKGETEYRRDGAQI